MDLLNTEITTIQNKIERRAYDAKISFCKKSIGQRFVNYLGPTYYNSLPVEMNKRCCSKIITVN